MLKGRQHGLERKSKEEAGQKNQKLISYNNLLKFEHVSE